MEEKVKAIVERWNEEGNVYSRLAMEQIEELFKPKRIVFEHVGDRMPKTGEYFMIDGRIDRAKSDFVSLACPIYRVVEGAEHLK